MNPEFGFAGGLPAGAVPSHVGPGSIALVGFQNISVIVVNKLYSGKLNLSFSLTISIQSY